MSKMKSGLEGVGAGGVDAAMKAADVVGQGFQALAAETAEYSQRAYKEGMSAFEKFSGARSIEAVMAVQTDYAKSAYEGYVSQMAKVGEIFGRIARDAGSPFGGYFGQDAK